MTADAAVTTDASLFPLMARGSHPGKTRQSDSERDIRRLILSNLVRGEIQRAY